MTFIRTALAAAALGTLLSGCSVAASAEDEAEESVIRSFSGAASWYGPGFHGRTTANGERYDMNKLTAAHKSLPFGTRVRVTNASTGKSVVVRINDRGPFVGNRVIDLSRKAATDVGMIRAGVAKVKLEILEPAAPAEKAGSADAAAAPERKS